MQEAINQQNVAADKRSILPWAVCILAALFYCYAYFLRVSPSVMMGDLLKNFHINATQFGTLSAFYYYAYAPMQIPVGLIVDRFSIHKVMTSACLLAVLGLGIFISADNFYVAAGGRFLVGLGSAFAYISVLKLATMWLPPNRFAIMAGLTTSMGMLAAAFSDNYLTHFVASVGYRDALFSALIAGGVICALIFVFIHHPPESRQQMRQVRDPLSIKQSFELLGGMVKSSQMWLIGIIGCLLYLPATVFLDVWGIPYLKAVHGLSADDAAWIAAVVFFGWIVASPLIGAISDSIQKRRLPLVLASVIATTVLAVIFYGPTLSKPVLYFLMFILGASCGSHPLCFSLSKENNPISSSGTAIAFVNTVIMLGGVIFQPFVGKLLDMHAAGLIVDGIPVYTGADYTFALSIIPIGLTAAILLSYFLNETHCEVKE